MNWLLLAGSGLVVLPGLTAESARRIPPAARSRVFAILLFGGMLLFVLGLTHEATPALLTEIGQPELARACRRLGGHVLALGLPGALLVATVVVGGLVATGWQIAGVLRLRRALRDCAVVSGRANQLGTGEKACELVVVPEPRVVALTVPGRPDRIVVSTGLRERLPRTEFDAVLRHEQAHLSLRHARVLLFAVALMATVGRLPPVRRSIDALRGALEVWADEAAAGDDRSQRGTLRSALLRIAAEPSAIRTVGGAGLMVSSRADALAGAATTPTSGGSLATIGALAVRGLVAVPLLLVILHAWQLLG